MIDYFAFKIGTKKEHEKKRREVPFTDDKVSLSSKLINISS